MKAYIITTKKRIEPFGDYPRNCLIVNKTLASQQRKTLSASGIEQIFVSNASKINDDREHITLSDNLYFTPELLSEFITKSKEQKSNTVCALKKGVTTLRTAVSLQELKQQEDCIDYNLWYFPEKKFREEVCKSLIINPDELIMSVLMPKHMCESDKGYAIPMTEKFVIQIDHWVNLWIANIVTILAEIARVQKMPKVKKFVFALKARSINKWKILCGLNEIGQNCDIHPTAYVESSTIGNNVVIGAGAVVKESVIGNNTFIGNGVVVEESVIGEKSSILHGHILYSVLYPGTFSVAQIISASFIGKDTFIGGYTALTDFRFDGKNVTVIKNGIKVDSGNMFLGSCLGHDVYLGSGCVIAPGRMIPNGSRIVLEKERIFTSANNFKTDKARLL